MVYAPGYSYPYLRAAGLGYLAYNASKTGTSMAYKGGISRTRTKTTRRRKTVGFSTAVKRVLARDTETKYNVFAGLPASFLHNNIYSMCFNAKVVQGTGEGTRIDDSINLIGCSLKGVINTAAVTGAFSYRLMVVWSTVALDPAALGTGGLAFANLFLPGGIGNPVFALVNPKACTVLHDEVIDINSLIAVSKDIMSFDIKVPLSGKFNYVATGSKFGKTKNLYVVAIPTVIGGSSGVTDCGFITFDAQLKYKDS